MDIELHNYKGFSIQALVYKRAALTRTRGRLYDSAVRISFGEGASLRSAVFHLRQLAAFEHFGEARRAGRAYGQRLINDNDAALSVLQGTPSAAARSASESDAP